MAISREDANELIKILKAYVDKRLPEMTKSELTATEFEDLYMRAKQGGTPLDQSKFRQYIRLITANLKGDKGDKGKSAYQQACEGGYQGTEQEFNLILASAQTQLDELKRMVKKAQKTANAGL